VATTRRARALTLGHQQQLNLVRDQQALRLGALWNSVGDVADDARFIELAKPIVRSGRLTSARLTTAYLNGYQVVEAGGRNMAVLSADVLEDVVNGVRGGELIDDVLHRPVVAARTTLSKGGLWSDAMASGRSLVETIARTDVTLIERATMTVLGRSLRPRGWVRIVEANPCSFCSRAAGQVVSTPDISPIHPNCHCTLEPIYSDVTRQIPVDKPTPVDDFEFEVEDHGEYGPTAVKQYK